MGIENERTTALSVESIPKSISEAAMEPTAEAETAEPLERQTPQKSSEKNGNLDIQSIRDRESRQCCAI